MRPPCGQKALISNRELIEQLSERKVWKVIIFFGLTIKNIAPELLFGYNIENSRNETEQEAFP